MIKILQVPRKLYEKKLFIFATVFFSIALTLSGCVTAGVLAAKKTIATIEGSDVSIVTITEKKKDIIAINKVIVDMEYLQADSQERQEQQSSTYNAIITALQENGLYQPENTNGDKLNITITNVTDSYADKSVQSYVTLYDNKGYQVLSVVYIITGKGLRRLEYVKEKFAKELATYLKQPVQNN